MTTITTKTTNYYYRFFITSYMYKQFIFIIKLDQTLSDDKAIQRQPKSFISRFSLVKNKNKTNIKQETFLTSTAIKARCSATQINRERARRYPPLKLTTITM